METPLGCFLCGEKCAEKCPKCEQIFACSSDHLQVHRCEEKCLPWTVKFQPGVGRTLVAARDIQSFELIMKDTPLVIVKELTNLGEKPKDASDFYHKIVDIKEVHIDPSQTHKLLKVIELLQLRGSNIKKWNWLNQFLSHQEKRSLSNEFQDLCENFTRVIERIGISDVSSCLVAHLLGILETNSISLDESIASHALFPYLSLTSHSCLPNCEHWVNGEEAVIRAKKRIKMGEELTIRYTYLCLHRTLLRKVINNAWFFTCICDRCNDTSELGTNSSSFKCFNCREGFLQEEESQDSYVCHSCKMEMSVEKIIEKATYFRSLEESTPINKIPNVIFEMEKDGAHELYHSVIVLKLRYVEEILKTKLNSHICGIVLEYTDHLYRYMEKLNPGISTMKGRLLFCIARVNDYVLKESVNMEEKVKQKTKQEIIKRMILAKKMISNYVI